MYIVNSLEAARALLVASRQSPVASKVALVSPPFAACYAGVNYYRHLVDALRTEFPAVEFSFTLCCGDDPAIAHDALRLGFSSVVCACSDGMFNQLQAAAETVGAVVMRNYPALDASHKAATNK